MTKFRSFSILIFVFLILQGCTSLYNPPLIFGQGHSVGITINGSMPEQRAELTIGYKDADIAIVPVTVSQGNGDSTQIKSSANEKSDQDFKDALSVLGQFEVNASANGNNANAVLGKFFATGMAAKKLADGFADKLRGESTNQNNPTNKP